MVSQRSHKTSSHQLIPFNLNGVANMKNNPHITVTGNVTSFDKNNHSFTMTPTPYAILTCANDPFPIHAHFADSTSKKRWGNEGPKAMIGSTITREYNEFRNLCGLRVGVVGGAGKGWQITTPRNPQPLARVDGFVGGCDLST